MQPTLNLEVFRTVATQLMTRNSVELAGKTIRVGRTGALRLRTAAFTANGREYQAIEQNPDKPSRWGELARSGHQVVQFKDVATNKFVAVAVDGEVQEYGRLGKKK